MRSLLVCLDARRVVAVDDDDDNFGHSTEFI